MSLRMTIIGKVISPYGIKGEVKVYPYSDFLDRCYLLKKLNWKEKATAVLKK